MKLSILIPVFNYDCRQLVGQLLKQLPQDDAEIIIADDCSTDPSTRQFNNEMASWEGCKVWNATSNMGRASIRNRLADLSQGDYLIFIDCDARVENEHFISNYLDALGEHDVVCGGTGNLKECPSPEVVLRWKYETRAEQRLTLEYRRRNPYAQFTTFNFAIRKNIFMQLRFNENLIEYGHEDTQFGIELMKRGIEVYHIENKLIHLGLDDGNTYLQKTETALRSLKNLSGEEKQMIRIARIALRLDRFHLTAIIRIFHSLFGRMERNQLCSAKPCLKLLNLYKLGYYCSLR